jgi:uncharacterized protein YlxP (DUF503 family)
MIVGIAIADLHIPAARSLKDKRRVVKGMVERLHHRYRISVAETDFHDLHQRARIGLALVNGSRSEAERSLDEIRRILEMPAESQLIRWETDFVESVL